MADKSFAGVTPKLHRMIKDLRVKCDSYKQQNKQFQREIDDCRKHKTELKFINRILAISDQSLEKNSYLEKLVGEIQEFTGCEAVGIRLLDEKKYIPYEAYTGFSKDFYESESPLSTQNDKCMCINVITGNTDSNLRFYSELGSFYMNGTTKFLATVSEEQKGQTRNRCNEEGYESVALIPVRRKETILGLIHLADKNEKMVPLELVNTIERTGMLIGPAIQRIQDEDLLKEQKQKYHTIADFTYDWEYWVDPEGNFVYVSPSCEQMTGYRPEEFMKDPDLLKNITHPDDHEILFSHKQNTSETIEHYSLDFRIIDRFGKEIWVSHCCQAVYDENGKYLGKRGSNRNISERKRAEKAVVKSVQLWQSTFDGITDGVCLLDSDAKILLSNQSMSRMFEKTHDQIIGRSCCEIIHDSPIHLDGCPLVRMRSSLKREELELSIGDKWFQVIVDPITDDDGKLTGAVHIVSDITERKQAEGELKKLLKVLTDKNAELQSIVYVASHDLRSPLVNVTGFGDELTRDCNKLKELLQDAVFDGNKAKKANSIINESIPESLYFIMASAKKMHSLLEGLLQVSRIGTAEINIGRLDMNKIISHVIETSQFKAKECGATITVDQLGNCLGDGIMINQVFSNIIDNALKYLDTGRKGKIHISCRTEGRMNIYCVEDNGMGIELQYQNKIFEVFHRLEPEDSNGEGLGLTIVTRILGRNDGTIRVESKPGKGSRFFISLPAANA